MNGVWQVSVLAAFLLGTFAVPLGAADDDKPIWLVVTRAAFVEAIRPLARERREQGFDAVISTASASSAITGLKRRPAFILLVGDAGRGQERLPWHIPAEWRELYRWQAQQEEHFASDAILGDFDGDLVPDVPVGRLPVRTREQLDVVVGKILAFEKKQLTPDDLRLPVWSGAPGFSPTVDSFCTMLLLAQVGHRAPAWVAPWLISADPAHPLCGWPPDHGRMFTGQLKRGGVLAVMIGHGMPDHFHSMRFRDATIAYTKTEAAQLATGNPGPPLVIICCHCGSFAGRRNSLAESLVLMRGGPCAVVGATTESHPLPNYFTAISLLKGLSRNEERLGSLWLAVQRDALRSRNFLMEAVLRGVEGKLEENLDVAKLRRDQILMYALLGDPAMRLHLPEALEATVKRQDDGWHWEVRKPREATRLYVTFREAGRAYPKTAHPFEKVTARERFRLANATYDFATARELPVGLPWKGVLDKEGTLRLVAVGPGRIYVATSTLKAPEEQPAAGENP